MTIINQYDMIIPIGSRVIVSIDSGVPVDTELSAVQTPSGGYKFKISYFKLTVPDGVEANIIVSTGKGQAPLLASNVTNSTIIIVSTRRLQLDYLDSFALYVKTLQDIESQVDVVLEYAGRLVVPYIG